jgi:hypothetical protein
MDWMGVLDFRLPAWLVLAVFAAICLFQHLKFIDGLMDKPEASGTWMTGPIPWKPGLRHSKENLAVRGISLGRTN